MHTIRNVGIMSKPNAPQAVLLVPALFTWFENRGIGIRFDENTGLYAAIFRRVLAGFVRGRMHMHFGSTEDGLHQMREAGFLQATIHDPRNLPETGEVAQRPGGRRVRILEANVARGR